MNDYINYIDIPTVPENLIEPLDVIINKLPKPNSVVSSTYEFFQTRIVSQDLEKYIKDVFKVDCFVQYQIIKRGIHIHKDKGRNVAFNYLLDTGGPNASTFFYDENKKPVYSHVIKSKAWHRIKTDIYHNVNFLINPRIAISVYVYDYKWDAKFLNFTEFGPA